jgi:hypothetical protein
MDILLDIIGWIAMLCILLAFYLISNEKVTARSKKYQYLNILGSSLFVINLTVAKAWPAVALNVIYALIATSALLRTYKKTKQ